VISRFADTGGGVAEARRQSAMLALRMPQPEPIQLPSASAFADEDAEPLPDGQYMLESGGEAFLSPRLGTLKDNASLILELVVAVSVLLLVLTSLLMGPVCACLPAARKMLMAFGGSVSYVEYAAEEPWQSAEQLQHVPLRPSHSDLDACPSRPLSTNNDTTNSNNNNNNQTTRANPVYFWIGDEEQPEQPSTAQHLDDQTTSRPLSPVAPQTESEPEAELYPESGCSTPRQGRVMQSQPFPLPLVQPLSGVAFKGAAERPLPAPAAARRTGLPRQEAAREDNYAAVHGSGKVLMLYASPLCRLDASFGGPVPMPPLPFEREWEEVVLTPHGEAQHLRSRPAITLAASCLTAGSLQKALVRGTPGGGASILHISAHGAGGGLVLEDGRGTAHLLSCELLRGLLALRQEAVAESSNNNNNGKSCPRLVILNACNSQPAGLCFAESGVPHVVCTASDTRDSWSRLFLRTLYACLFQGSSVGGAFAAAMMAVRCDPSMPEAAAASFRLLPEGQAHCEVLFHVRGRSKMLYKPGTGSADCSEREEEEATARKRRWQLPTALVPGMALAPRLPELPEDFLGRSLDVWSILQHLAHRRVIVLCDGGGEASHMPGMGKSAALDAVHRSAALRLGTCCVAVQMGVRGAQSAFGPMQWLQQIRRAVHQVLLDELRRGRPGTAARTSVPQSRCLTRNNTNNNNNEEEQMEDQEQMEALIRELCELASVWRHQELSTGSSQVPLISTTRATGRSRAGSKSGSGSSSGGCWRSAGSASGALMFAAGGGSAGGVLLLLHGCDHLVQQQPVQEILAELLRRCPACRIVLSSRARMVGPGSGHFKVVHHELRGLEAQDAARLFLRRAQRPLTWAELRPSSAPSEASSALLAAFADNPKAAVTLGGPHQAEILALVAAQPALAALRGSPGAIIELGSQLGPRLCSLQDLKPAGKEELAKPRDATAMAYIAI